MRNLGFVLFAASVVSGLQRLQSSGAPGANGARGNLAAPDLRDNEVSGDLSIIDSGNYNLLATIPLGKRPRGIHPSPDHKTIYVALSGSPDCRAGCR